MLIELAIGDAYGAGFEFVKPVYTEKHHKLEKYIPHFADNIPAGHYTDDTQMTIAIAELLLNHDLWTPEIIAEQFVSVYKRDPIDGYAKGFQYVLDEVENGKELIQRIEAFSKENGPSERNGAAMRSVPLGLISSKDELLSKAEMQAKITHDSESGIFSSKAIALSAYYFVNEIGPKEQLANYLYEELGVEINSNKTSRCACDAKDTVDAVVTVLMASETQMDILNRSVLMGGDTDSVASIACGIASLSKAYKNNFAEFLYNDLQGGPYGKDFLQKLEHQLKTMFKF